MMSENTRKKTETKNEVKNHETRIKAMEVESKEES